LLRDLIVKNRSYRRFEQDLVPEKEELRKLVDLARLSASAGNKQPLKYILSTEMEKNEKIFSCLSWAAYLKDWNGPEEGEKPPAYIIILGDQELSINYDQTDAGIACQSILLGAVEQGLGGCIFASINRKKLREELGISERHEIIYVIALGRPRERVVLEETGEDGDIKYWHDEEGTNHVPKRPLNELIIEV